MKTEDTFYNPQTGNRSNFSNSNATTFNTNGESASVRSAASPTLVQVGTAGALGLMIGGVGMALSSYAIEDNTQTAEELLSEIPDDEIVDEEVLEEDETATTGGASGHLSDGEIAFAEGINDNMSFSQAFAAARAEVGAGGAFVWHGNVYGTYTAAEWNAMSPGEQQAYYSHFDWSHIQGNTGTGNTASTHNVEQQPGQEHTPEEQEQEQEQQQEQEQEQQEHQEQNTQGQNQQQNQSQQAGQEHEPEIEVVSIVQDAETGNSYVELRVDGHESYFIDEDGDGIYDTMLTDTNDNGQLDEGEMFDISGSGFTMESVAAQTGVEITIIGENTEEIEEIDIPGDDPEDITEEIIDEDIDITDEEALDI